MYPCQIHMYENSLFRGYEPIDGKFDIKHSCHEFHCDLIYQSFAIMVVEDDKMDIVKQTDMIKREMIKLCEGSCKYIEALKQTF